MRTGIIQLIAALGLTAATSAAPPPYHRISEIVSYRCLFNHELLIVCHNKDLDRPYIASFIDRLDGTDVDAVMCCPTAWRLSLFPSTADPTWRGYTPGQPPSKLPHYDHIMRYLHAGAREASACDSLPDGKLRPGEVP